mmetsp:Transcript_9892/g.36720  ORF Transcript_9892/g.36720 Transcript_9892/m.36720 type:complete len:269 (-) Transcript_9892:2514-3320(-)
MSSSAARRRRSSLARSRSSLSASLRMSASASALRASSSARTPVSSSASNLNKSSCSTRRASSSARVRASDSDMGNIGTSITGGALHVSMINTQLRSCERDSSSDRSSSAAERYAVCASLAAAAAASIRASAGGTARLASAARARRVSIRANTSCASSGSGPATNAARCDNNLISNAPESSTASSSKNSHASASSSSTVAESSSASAMRFLTRMISYRTSAMDWRPVFVTCDSNITRSSKRHWSTTACFAGFAARAGPRACPMRSAVSR